MTGCNPRPHRKSCNLKWAGFELKHLTRDKTKLGLISCRYQLRVSVDKVLQPRMNLLVERFVVQIAAMR